MAYKFNAKLDDILKILNSENSRIEGHKNSFQSSIERLDVLKVNNKSPITTSAELWDRRVGDLLKGKSGLGSIIRLENAYIKANQYIDFANGTTDELYRLGAQLLVLFRKYNHQELLPDEKQISLPVDLRDCNEIFRYITVWDLNDFVYKREEKYLKDKAVLLEFNDPLLRYSLDEMGFSEYVDALIAEYNAKLAEADKAYHECEEACKKIVDNIDFVNKLANFVPSVPYNFHDGSRAPVGCESANESNKLYVNTINAYLKWYKNKNIPKRDDVGRE